MKGLYIFSKQRKKKKKPKRISFIVLFSLLIFGCPGSLLLYAAFSSCGKQKTFFLAVRGFLIVVASLVAEHRLQACRLQWLKHIGSVNARYGSRACELQQLWLMGPRAHQLQ